VTGEAAVLTGGLDAREHASVCTALDATGADAEQGGGLGAAEQLIGHGADSLVDLSVSSTISQLIDH
jgi:hypothetical protein